MLGNVQAVMVHVVVLWTGTHFPAESSQCLVFNTHFTVIV